MTAAITRAPARATTLRSVPRPSAAMEMMVSRLARGAAGARAAVGTRPAERRAASARKPTMNHGTSLCSGSRPGFGRSPAVRCGAASSVSSRMRRVSSDRPSTTGPSISTRTSLTSVPICTATAPSGAVAARTWGTA